VTRVAFVGLGNMGTPMSRRLIEAGHDVVGSDPSVAARERLAEAGGSVADSAADAARGSAVVILMLPNSAVVRSVVDEMIGADALADGALVIDMSSSEPLATRELRDELAAHGVRFADAPVSGGVTGAVGGTLTIMVGSDPTDRDDLAQVLAELGRVVECGGVGAGHAVKALNNLMSATHLWATSEAMEVAVRFGLDPKVVLDVVSGSSGRSGSTDNKWPNFIRPGTFDSGFGLRLMLKDMRIAEALAAELGSPLELGSEAVAHWAAAAEALPADADHTRVAQYIAEQAETGEAR